MKYNYKTPTLKEKVEAYESFLESINRSLRTSDMEKLKSLIQNADTWAYIKTSRVKGICPKEHQKILNEAFWKLNKE